MTTDCIIPVNIFKRHLSLFYIDYSPFYIGHMTSIRTCVNMLYNSKTETGA